MPSRTGFATAWLVVIAACGGGGGDPPDAPHGAPDAVTADATPDAVPDAPPIPCSGDPGGAVTVLHELAGAYVVFHDPDGCVRSTTRTNAFGVAHGTVPADGMVTVVAQGVLFTVTRIQPGDTVDLARPRYPAWDTADTLEVDFAFDPEAFTRNITTGCGYDVEDGGLSAPPVLVPTSRCGSDDAVSVIAAELGPTGPKWAAVEDVALDPSGVTAVTLPAWRTDLATTDLTITQVPASVGMVYAKATPIDDGVSLPVCDYPVSLCSAAVSATATTAVALPRIPGFGDGVAVSALLQHQQSEPWSYSRLIQIDPGTAPIDLDATTAFLPAVSAGWNGDVDAPELSWSSTSPGATADAAILSFAGMSGDAFALWFVLVPGAVDHQRLPALPPELALTFATDWTPGVGLYERSDVDGYADGRTRPWALARIAQHELGWPYEVVTPGFSSRIAWADGGYLP